MLGRRIGAEACYLRVWSHHHLDLGHLAGVGDGQRLHSARGGTLVACQMLSLALLDGILIEGDRATGDDMTTSKDRLDHPLERMIFFSDAVFAIAITLLIIEIQAPHLPRASPSADYLLALVDLFPKFFSFFISFLVIGAFWAGHHRAFGLAEHYSERLVWPNLFLLCSVAFIPFSTAFMGSNIGATVPGVFYDLSLIVAGLLNIRLVYMVTSPPIVRADVSAETIALVRARGVAVVLGAICALAFCFLDARYSQIAMNTIPIWHRLLRALVKRRLAKMQS